MTSPTTAEGAPAVGQMLRRIAQELREHPERWTQSYCARDAERRPAPPRSPSASCWCALGLLMRDFKSGPSFNTAEIVLTGAVPAEYRSEVLAKTPIAAFNDAPGRTAAEVADLFDRAADKAGAL